MPLNKRAVIEVTSENIWFTERYLNLFDILELFPADAISPDEGKRGIPIVLKTDLGFDISSDIEHTKLQLRNRSKHHGWMRWTNEKSLQAGDRIVLEKIGNREFLLTLERIPSKQIPF